MTFDIQSCVPVQVLDPARRLHVCEDVLARCAHVPGAARLVPHAQRALDLHLVALERAAEWQLAQQDVARHEEGAVELYKLVSRTVTNLDATLEWLEATGAADEAEQARAVRAAAVPKGVGAVTSQVYVGVYATVKVMLTRLAGPDFASAVAVPAIAQCLDRLATLNDAFGGKLTRPERMTYDVVREADATSFEAYVALYARIVGMFPTNDEADLGARSRLLEPAFAAQAEAAKHRAERRAANASSEEEESSAEAPDPSAGGESAAPAPAGAEAAE